MARTHDLGRLFWSVAPTWPGPFLERSVSTEIDEPYRRGPGILMRLTRKTALTVGWWAGSYEDERKALSAALRAPNTPAGEVPIPTGWCTTCNEWVGVPNALIWPYYEVDHLRHLEEEHEMTYEYDFEVEAW